jgi:hypothetical protein
MPAGLVLQFPQGVGEKEYAEVNAKLGLDMRTGAGDWPEGLLSHAAGMADDGFVVTEVWQSQQAQARFMESRLGPAFGAVGVPQPSRVVWFDVLAAHHRT